MKKIIMLVAALLVIASGIMAVGAYEGHLVDVKAHVENAIGVSNYDVTFGTVFPEAEIETYFQIGLSNSFLNQCRYSTVNYELWWEPKPIPAGANVCDPDGDGNYTPIYPYIDVMIDSSAPGTMDPKRVELLDGDAVAIGTGSLNKQGDACDYIHLLLDPPVFACYVNSLTDTRTPSGILESDQYCFANETLGCGEDDNFAAVVPYADLGNNLKIQVISVVVDAHPCPGPSPVLYPECVDLD